MWVKHQTVRQNPSQLSHWKPKLHGRRASGRLVGYIGKACGKKFQAGTNTSTTNRVMTIGTTSPRSSCHLVKRPK